MRAYVTHQVRTVPAWVARSAIHKRYAILFVTFRSIWHFVQTESVTHGDISVPDQFLVSGGVNSATIHLYASAIPIILALDYLQIHPASYQ